MLRVLVLSTRFPDRTRPNFGNSVGRQAIELAGRPGVEVRIAAPIAMPLFPWPRRPRHRGLGALPESGSSNGLEIHRPRFAAWPYPRRLTPALLALPPAPQARNIPPKPRNASDPYKDRRRNEMSELRPPQSAARA